MTYYAIVDNHSGCVWEIAKAKSPKAACRWVDSKTSPYTSCDYESVSAYDLATNDTAYRVFELDRATYDSLLDADGQDDEVIQMVNDYGKLADVLKVGGVWI